MLLIASGSCRVIRLADLKGVDSERMCNKAYEVY